LKLLEQRVAIGVVMRITSFCAILLFVVACGRSNASSNAPASTGSGTPAEPGPDATATGTLPLVLVRDAELPGRANRFDYQDVDAKRGRLVIAHMNDASVVIVDMKDGNVLKVVPSVPTARGVVVADEVGRIFVTSSPNQVVAIDAESLNEVARITTGQGPDGIAWDPTHRILGVSDQKDGAVSLIEDAGNGRRRTVALGTETGNVVFDRSRATFWVTVVGGAAVDRLVEIDPIAAKATTTIALPGCDGAHGLRIHPDAQSALVACEGNSKLVRVNLDGAHDLVTATTGSGPDVLAIDPMARWIYVAAESGDLTVFDLSKPGLEPLDREHPADHAHSVAVDPATRRVFFPLESGPNGKPVLRIMRPGP
jgi:YVTN family beta-propeller protein